MAENITPGYATSVHKTRYAQLSYCGSDLVRIDFLYEDYELDVQDILDIQAACRCVVPETASFVKILVIPGKNGLMTREARELELFSEEKKGQIKKIAIIIPSLHKRLLGRLFFTLKKNKASFPYKFFSSVDEATVWLNR